METEQRFEVMQRQMDAEPGVVRTLDDSTRTVELSFSSETPVERWSHKSGAVMLERLNKTGCLLYNHNRDKVIGKVIKASVKNRRGIATVQFDDDDESLIYYNKVKNGTLRNVSVGYIVHEQQRTATGKDETMHVTYTATKWEPIEISIVSVPADISVGVGRSVTENGQVKNYVDYRMKINQNLIMITRRNKFR